MKHRIRANTAWFKTTDATAKLATFATAKLSIKHSDCRGLLLCVWFGVDLRSKYYVDANSPGRWRKTGATANAK